MNSRVIPLGVLLSLVGAALGSGWMEGSALHVISASPQERAACGIHCGTERWSVKTLTDFDHNIVDFTPKEVSVDWLVSQERPTYLPADQRVGPIETQTYKVRARLVGSKLEKDQDFHIVIADVEETDKTMIVEVPSPDCAGSCSSGHAEEFRKARAVVAELSNQVPGVTVVVTGVGFFDFLHGQTGVAPNGIELHPVLKIELESASGLPSVPSPQASAEKEKKEVKVWVNTNSGVYHCPESRWFGRTKQGKYMGECEAKKAGYRPAYNSPCGSSCL